MAATIHGVGATTALSSVNSRKKFNFSCRGSSISDKKRSFFVVRSGGRSFSSLNLQQSRAEKVVATAAAVNLPPSFLFSLHKHPPKICKFTDYVNVQGMKSYLCVQSCRQRQVKQQPPQPPRLEGLEEEMDRDPRVCVMGEDVGHYGGSYKVTKGLAEKYGDLRVLDTPIAENSFTGMGIGAAMTGLVPIVEE